MTKLVTRIAALGLTFGLIQAQTGAAGSSGGESQITITPPESQTVITGAPERFTGSVRVRSLFAATSPGRASGGQVTFPPGARSAWHTHPLGQALIVTDGMGLVQQWGGPVQAMRKGDVIWIPAGVKHWHGASPGAAVTHIAIQEARNGANVTWMEKVTDEQYGSGK